jgi:transposase-like protein
MTVNLTDPIFNNEEAARRHFEAIRWPDGPECPHCGVIGEATELKGKSTRAGVYKCKACEKPFTATIGTVYERSHIPLHKWLLATHLLCASKKGISAHQLWRMLAFGSYRTAWFMAHRIREGMREALPEGGLGGANKVVEIDETYVGGKEANKHKRKRANKGRGAVAKEPVLSLVERDGSVRSFHVANVTATTLRPIIVTHVNRAS